MPDITIYKKIIEYLSDLIIANEDIPGFKLPSERSLADKFNASRRPIRFAYSKLIERGHVEKNTWQGSFC
jgi:GntR family transcriptional repressor for pyruvate dehydrogenase complex